MNKIGIVILIFMIYSCNSKKTENKLPYLGDADIIEKNINGNIVFDTVYPRVPEFSFMDQDSNMVTNSTMDGKIYVADFIFLSCPTICPVMTTQMLKVYKNYASNPNIIFLSHTIDPERDSIPRLKEYATGLNVASDKWHFVTGNQDDIYHIADHGYFAIAQKDEAAPGGYTHSGGLLLVDKNGHLRGVYDGTDTQETDRLIKDLKILLKEFSK